MHQWVPIGLIAAVGVVVVAVVILLLAVEADEARVSEASVREAIAAGGVLRLDEEVGGGWLVVTGEEWTFFDLRSPLQGCTLALRPSPEQGRGSFPEDYFLDPCWGGGWSVSGEYLGTVDPNFTPPWEPADLTVIERGRVEKE